MPDGSRRKDFEDRFFDMLTGQIDKLADRLDNQDKTLDAILQQAQYTNGKVKKLRVDVDALQDASRPVPKRKDLPEFLHDPKVIQIVLYLSIALLLVVAAFTGFDLKGVL